VIDEMALFSTFPTPTRRYIVRALDFGLPRGKPLERWVGSFFDIATQAARADLYHSIPIVRRRLEAINGPLENWMDEYRSIQRCADFDLRFPEIASMVPFGFLYERLYGPKVRPWLPAIFMAAAASPAMTEEGRLAALQSVTMFDIAAPSEQGTPCALFPEWDGD